MTVAAEVAVQSAKERRGMSGDAMEFLSLPAGCMIEARATTRSVVLLQHLVLFRLRYGGWAWRVRGK